MRYAFLLALVMAGNGPTTLYFSAGGGCLWQRVTANGQILGTVPGSRLESVAGCYGMGRLTSGVFWFAAERQFHTLDIQLQSHDSSVAVETIVGSSGHHLYRIRRGSRLKRPRPQIAYAVHLDEISPITWRMTRSCLLPGTYGAFGSGHLSVDPSESIAYYATEFDPITGQPQAMGTVHRLDLITSEPLEPLVSRQVGSGGLQVLPDASVVVGFTDRVQRFAPAGDLLQTCSVGALRVGQGLVTAGADGSSFWVQGFVDGTVRHQWNTPANGVQWDAPFIDARHWL